MIMSKKYKPTKKVMISGFKGAAAKFNGTYEERAGIMKRKAEVVEIKTINTALSEFETGCGDMAKVTVHTVNTSRKIGLHLMTMCGHEQISFEFWRAHCEGKIKCTFEQAKSHVAVAHKLPEPAKTIQEAAKVIQTCWLAANLIEMPVREESQRALNISFLQKALAGITTVRATFEKAWREVPIEKMKPSQLSEFLKDTQWLEDARDKAQRLIGDSMRS